jgi:deoxycytidylate deaminase
MLNLAIKLASQLQNKKQRICAIITDKRGRILSFGVNSYSKTHPRMAYYSAKCNDYNKIYLHAEMDSLIHCKQKGHTLYVARVDKKGNSLPCKPCEICSLAIKDAGIKEVITT